MSLAPDAAPPRYEGARRFTLSALVQGADLAAARAPQLPWAIAYTDEMDLERFYLTNSDLLRDLASLLNKLRTLPENASVAHQMLNQGFPCYLFFQRESTGIRINVAAYREGRDRLLKDDIQLPWGEFVALFTLGVREFLHDLLTFYPLLTNAAAGLIGAFNGWAERHGLVPFQPPAIDPAELEAMASSPRASDRRGRLAGPIYLQEWRTHKSQNLRLNTALTVTFVALLAVAAFPLGKIPLGYWLYPVAAIAVPWFLVTRYPSIPINSPLWTERGVRFRAYFPDSVLLLSAGLILLAASLHEANVMWVWLWPLGWLVCLFCGLGFPRSHWARPIWDWSRGMLVWSLVLATVILYLLADLGGVYARSLARAPSQDPPRAVVVHRRAQEAIAKWNPSLRSAAQPVAYFLDEYTNRRAIHEFFPHGGWGRQALSRGFQFLWLLGALTYGLGLKWSQLPSPMRVKVRGTVWQ
ncbi:MAG TPA: hypothetical protein VEI97_02770 [bacterium]|nr:hypothetical protein [bacterium]